MSRNFSRNRPRDERPEADYYQTPYCLTRPLLDEIKGFLLYCGVNTVCDYCCGSGAIVHVLKEYGFRVKASDIRFAPPVDFFTIPQGDRFGIMNPPFRLFNRWVRHCFDVFTLGFALLAPTTYLQGVDRFNKEGTGIFQNKRYPLGHIYTFNRYPMLSPTLREDGLIETGMQALSWMVWYNYNQEMVGCPSLHEWFDIDDFVVRKRSSHGETKN
jgi:hypothetical protein